MYNEPFVIHSGSSHSVNGNFLLQVASGSSVLTLQTSSVRQASQFAPFQPAGHVLLPCPCAQVHVPPAPAGLAETRVDNDGVAVPIGGRLIDGDGAAAGPETPRTGGGSASRGRETAVDGGAALKVGRSGQEAKACGCC